MELVTTHRRSVANVPGRVSNVNEICMRYFTYSMRSSSVTTLGSGVVRASMIDAKGSRRPRSMMNFKMSSRARTSARVLPELANRGSDLTNMLTKRFCQEVPIDRRCHERIRRRYMLSCFPQHMRFRKTKLALTTLPRLMGCFLALQRHKDRHRDWYIPSLHPEYICTTHSVPDQPPLYSRG